MTILLGADPEVFVKKNDGAYISAWKMVDGTKEKPQPVNGGALQYDGMALEFNINPTDSEALWEANITRVMGELEKHIPPGTRLAIDPVAHFGKEYMALQPEEAKILGCEPDFNAYTGDINNPPDADADFRTAAGHAHFGWTKDMPIDFPPHFRECMAIMKQADAALGLPLMIIEPDNIRKELYGKAGAFRPKPYGAEYRVSSNFWLSSKELRSFVFNMAQKLTEDFFNGIHYFDDSVQNIINNNDKKAAVNFLKNKNLFEPCKHLL